MSILLYATSRTLETPLFVESAQDMLRQGQLNAHDRARHDLPTVALFGALFGALCAAQAE